MVLVYLMMMAHIFKVSPSGKSYFTFLVLIYIFLEIAKKKKIMWSAMAFMAFVLSMQIIFNRISVADDLKLFVNVLFISCALNEVANFSSKERDKIYLSYIVSLIVSSTMRFFDSGFFNISEYTLVLKTEAFGAKLEGITRFSGLYQDPNYYTVNIILALCFVVILYYKRSIPAILCASFTGVIIYFGSLTYSKSFILFLIFPFTLLVFANHKLNRKGAQFFIIGILLGGITFLIVSNSHFIQMMQLRMDTGTSLTTGRSDIWEMYIDYIIDNPAIAIFGKGIGAPLMDNKAMHNTYVECFYHLGVVGTGLLVFVIAQSGVKIKKRIKRNYLNYAPLLVVLVTYSGLSQLHDYEFPFHFLLAYMALYLWDSNEILESKTQIICPLLLPDILDEKIKVL